jgi:hypothetical protein
VLQIIAMSLRPVIIPETRSHELAPKIHQPGGLLCDPE